MATTGMQVGMTNPTFNVPGVAYNPNAGYFAKPTAPTTPASPIPPAPIGSSPSPTPGVTSPIKVSTPVVTAKSAADDYTAKFAKLIQIQNDIKTQSDAKQKATLEAQQAQQLKDLQTADQSVKQQGLDVQKLQAKAQADTASAKLTAANSLSTPIEPTNQTPPTTPPANPTPAATDTTNSTDSNLSDYQSAQTSLSAAYDPILQSAQDQLTKITQGTFPLTPAQQAIYSSTLQEFNSQIEAQAQANRAYTGTVQEANFRQGGEYTPAISAGTIANAISYGVSKITEIDSKMGSTLATLQDGFNKQNYDQINGQYQELQKQYDDKSSQLKDMYDKVSAAAKDTRDYNLKVQQFNQDQYDKQQQQDLAIKKFKLDQTNSVFDNKIKSQQLSDSQNLQRAQIAKIYSDMSTADTSAAASWVTNIKAGTAKLSDVPANLKNAVSAGLANGTPQGVSSLLSTTQKSLQELNDYVTNNHGFTGAVGAKGIASLFGIRGTPLPGTQAADFDAKLHQVINDVVLPNLTILHGLGRVTDREFQSLQSSMTSLSPNLSEDEFKKELGSITSRINEKLDNNQPAVVSSGIKTALNAINPKTGKVYSPEEVINYLSNDPKYSDQISQARNTTGLKDSDILAYLQNQ